LIISIVDELELILCIVGQVLSCPGKEWFLFQDCKTCTEFGAVCGGVLQIFARIFYEESMKSSLVRVGAESPCTALMVVHV